MPDWATFAAFAGVVTTGLLLLSHASRGVVSSTDERAPSAPRDDSTRTPSETAPDDSRPPEAAADTGADAVTADSEAAPADGDAVPAATTDAATGDRPRAAERRDPDREIVLPKSGVRYRPPPREETPELSTAALLANVAFSQGLFGVALLAGAWYAQIPAAAFGANPATVSVSGLLVGVVLGLSLYAVNEVGAAVGTAYGLGRSEGLRESLAPDSRAEWAALLFVVLPVIAAFEELLFRGALVGVLAAGFGVSPWLLAGVSSVAFALGHGAQGRLGVLVTGGLGFVLAAAFVLTGSLFVVVVAHYLVNALEFVVHEGLGVEWGGDADGTE
jgi:membrane protease YdiL (CAAX protease family)